MCERVLDHKWERSKHLRMTEDREIDRESEREEREREREREKREKRERERGESGKLINYKANLPSDSTESSCKHLDVNKRLSLLRFKFSRPNSNLNFTLSPKVLNFNFKAG